MKAPDFLDRCTCHLDVVDGRDHVTQQSGQLIIELCPSTHGVAVTIGDRTEGPSLDIMRERTSENYYTRTDIRHSTVRNMVKKVLGVFFAMCLLHS